MRPDTAVPILGDQPSVKRAEVPGTCFPACGTAPVFESSETYGRQRIVRLLADGFARFVFSTDPSGSEVPHGPLAGSQRNELCFSTSPARLGQAERWAVGAACCCAVAEAEANPFLGGPERAPHQGQQPREIRRQQTARRRSLPSSGRPAAAIIELSGVEWPRVRSSGRGRQIDRRAIGSGRWHGRGRVMSYRQPNGTGPWQQLQGGR